MANCRNQFAHTVQTWLFRPGGKYNIAISRVVIATALYLTLSDGNFSWTTSNWQYWVEGRSDWSPKGIVKLLGLFHQGPPDAWLPIATYYLGMGAIAAMAVGFLGRISQVVATICTVFLVSLQTSFEPYWSHAYNVQLLAALAFMFGRSTDVWSVDAWIRRLGGHAPPNRGNVYWWPVLFAELAVTMFMFGAFVQKFRRTGFNWALSDNIRNSIVISWYQYRSDPPELAAWLISNPWLWKTAGTLQLFAQATTVLAVFLVMRPILRALTGGVFFLIEIFALAKVFKFWHPFWVPLCLLSVDFEYFWGALKGRGKAVLAARAAATGIAGIPGKTLALVGLFGVGLFSYYSANIAFRLGEKHLNYPFSSMAFYSETRARKPYAKSQYWLIYTGRADAYQKATDTNPISLWNRESTVEDQLFRVNTLADLKRLDAVYIERARRGLQVATPNGHETVPTLPEKVLYRSGLMAATPYPMPPAIVDFHMGLRAVRDMHGFRAVTYKLSSEDGDWIIDVSHDGFKNPKFEILARLNVREDLTMDKPVPLQGTWVSATRFQVAKQIDPKLAYALIHVQDAVLGIDETYYGPDNFRLRRRR